ncbi:MAG: ABC transporter permease [Treponema sp.]|nr:ABC transporter permease [Treponema sp.]
MNEGEKRQYSEYEIIQLIDDLTEAAYEAIDQAAAEAARAAVLSMIECEAAALREAAHQQAEAQQWRIEAEANLQAIQVAKKAGRKNTVIGVLIGIFGGLALGVGGTLIMSR